MTFGALKSADAVAKALESRDLTPERVSKAFRHIQTRQEYRAIYALLDGPFQEALEAMKVLKGHADW